MDEREKRSTVTVVGMMGKSVLRLSGNKWIKIWNLNVTF